jgi:hypothetical protein
VDRTFTHPSHPIRPRYPMFDRLARLQSKFDPGKVFEPPLFTKVAGQQGYTLYPGCALDFQCYCCDDSHCNAPGGPQAFKCVASAAFPELRVCKGPADTDPELIARYGRGEWVTRTDHTQSNWEARAMVDDVLGAPLIGPLARGAIEELGHAAGRRRRLRLRRRR